MSAAFLSRLFECDVGRLGWRNAAGLPSTASPQRTTKLAKNSPSFRCRRPSMERQKGHLMSVMLAGPQSFMEWPAPPSGVVGSPGVQEEELD
jgi:hypothetical protein